MNILHAGIQRKTALIVALLLLGFLSAQAQVAFNPTTTSFGYIALTKNSTRTITITNSGSSTVTISSISTTGDFSQTNNCPATLAVSASCTATGKFLPTATGTRNGTLVVTTTSGTSTMNISGVGAALGFSPSTFEFGNWLIGTSSSAQSIAFTNYSSSAVTFNSFTPSSTEITTTDNCRPSLAAGAGCTVNLTYTPTAIWNHKLYTLGVSTSDVNNWISANPIGGHGTGYGLLVSPTALSFYDVLVNSNSPTQTVSITNKAPVAISSLSLAPNDSNIIVTSNCPSSLATNQSCTATVSVNLAMTGSQFHGFNISSTDSVTPVLVNSVSTGHSIDISPSSYDWSDRLIGSSTPATITVANRNTAAITVTGITLSDYENINSPTSDLTQTNNCVGTLNPNQNCTVTVNFNPTVLGFKSYTIWVRTGETYQSHTDAWGTGYALGTTGSFDFGNVFTSSSATKTTTVTNNANSSIVISAIQLGAYSNVSLPAPSDFSLSANTCTGTLAAHATCTYTIQFVPTALGLESLSTWINSNDMYSPATSGWGTGVQPSPVITSLSQNSGSIGTAITISGAAFGATTGSVTFNGISATPTNWSNSSITVPVPTGATTGTVFVRAGALSSNGVAFTVTPAIIGLTPTSGQVSTSVLITGTSFGASQGANTVKFNGTPASPSYWSDTNIAAPVPTGATTGNVVVTVGGNPSNGVNFTVTTTVATLVSITVSPGNASVSAGDTLQLAAIGTYSDGHKQDLSAIAAWSSSAPGVATIDTTGLASAIDNGQTTIQASVGSVSGAVTLSVAPGQLDAIVTPAYQLISNQGTANQKAIAVGTDGFTRFITGSGGYTAPIIFVRCLDQDCASSHTKTFPIGYFAVSSMALGPDGFARIAYQDGGFLGFIQCGDDDCNSFTNTTEVDWTANGFASIAVGPDGTSYIVYDYFDEDAWVAESIDLQGVGMATCSVSGCSTTRIAPISWNDAMSGAITVGADGNPVIIYEDWGYGYPWGPGRHDEVHYYANGTNTVVSSDGVSLPPDVATGPDGFGRIIFPNQAGGADFIQCSNPSCSANHTSAISFSGAQGGSPEVVSLTVGADGNALIAGSSYIPGTVSSSVEYVHCTTANCSSYSDQSVQGDWAYRSPASIAVGPDDLVRMIAVDSNATVKHIHRRAPMTLYVRSFAPWEWFGCFVTCFTGNDRSFSTSTDASVTSKVTAVIQFVTATMKVVSSKVYSDPSHDMFGRTATDQPTLIVNPGVGNLSGNLHMEMAGANPLVPGAADIDTKLDMSVLLNSGQACFSGHLYGDAFPNAEVFVVDSSTQATMLLTFATEGGQDTGPFLYLPGNNNRDMGSFASMCVPYH